MPKLHFSTMVGPASFFQPYTVDTDFKHFVFQLSNDDGVASTRRTYNLVIFVIRRSNPTPVPIDHPDWKAVGQESFGRNIDFGNFVLTKAALTEIFAQNSTFNHLGFIAQKSGDVKFEKYVSYDVGPTDKTGKPVQALTRFSVIVNPSPPAG